MPGVRWTVGDVSARGWEALRVSVHCAVRLFGPDAEYVICVNSVGLERARGFAGALPECVRWREVSAADVPSFLVPHLGEAMAEGVGWKLLPARSFPGRHELALDNDCILWQKPAALEQWLAAEDRTLLAGDMERCLGRFQASAVEGMINLGIRVCPRGSTWPTRFAGRRRRSLSGWGIRFGWSRSWTNRVCRPWRLPAMPGRCW